ncbi:MAG: restriction endonuclease subunit S [Gammaproteobacteria bacterium HGW-Gammaproteobacteria-8]|nr:MAG: restriction endonuclease subunit S [Gammaproteobacteria bacterium HGW-Gammaproteobacteria-8]
MNLAALADIRMGYPFRSRIEHDPRGDVAVIQMKDMEEVDLVRADNAVRVMLPDVKPHHLLRAGDLLFRSRGLNNGAVQVGDGLGTAVLAAPMLLIRARRILPAYLCWYLNTPATQAHLAALAEGTSVRMISAEALKVLDIPLPPKATQERIAHAAVLAEREQLLLARVAELRRQVAQHLLLNSARRTKS